MQLLIVILFFAIGAILYAFNFKGYLVTEDNYDILAEVSKGTKSKSPRPAPQPEKISSSQQKEPSKPMSQISEDFRVRDGSSSQEVQVKEYGTMQGGEGFQKRSPKDFIK